MITNATESTTSDADAKTHYVINSIAVLDFETSNLPHHNFNRVGVTELSMAGFAADELRNELNALSAMAPRVLHKLTLLFNPLARVHDEAEHATGLNNYILEQETPFDENAAKAIANFVGHLQQPVCLVAHSGWKFDFPILKSALGNWGVQLPPSTVCVDSLRAFLEIDEKRALKRELVLEERERDCETEHKQPATATADGSMSIGADVLDDASYADDTNFTTPIKWQPIVLKTPERPQRPPLMPSARSAKRRLLFAAEQGCCTPLRPASKDAKLKARRALFTDMFCAQEQKFPPRGVYQLSNMYERVLHREPAQAHQAEADVRMLIELIQFYGIDFLAFAESQAVPFDGMPTAYTVTSPIKRKRSTLLEQQNEIEVEQQQEKHRRMCSPKGQ